MSNEYVGDDPIETVWREWVAPENATERELGCAAGEALLTFCDGWIEPLVVEALLGCFDRERRQVLAEKTPPRPSWLLQKEPLPPGVKLYNLYADAQAASLSRIERGPLRAWMERILEQPCPDPSRMEPTMVELVMSTCRVKLPSGFAHTGTMGLDSYAGIIEVPVEEEDGAAWVAGPRAGYAMHPPLSVAVGNDNGALILDVKIYWSPWRGELQRPGSDLYEAVRRFEQRDWSEAFV